MPSKGLIQYKKTSLNTRSRGRILLMLYDGAIRFLEQAKVAIGQNRPDLRGERISRAHAIISELNLTLDHDVSPDLCANLERLYLYMLNQVTEANRNNDVERITLVIDLLNELRSAWQEAVVVSEREEGKGPNKPQESHNVQGSTMTITG